MSLDPFDRFRQSMKIGYMEWHDGIGYDLDALDTMTPEDRLRAEEILVDRRAADWRDVEALDHIGSPRAIAGIREAVLAQSLDIRIEAAERLARRDLLGASEIESIILDALDRATILNGLTKTLRFAAANATAPVRRKLLLCAMDGNDDVRVHAAALAHFLHGGSSSAFDSRFRSLYLRFRVKDRAERREAFSELCANIGIDPH